MIKLWKTISKEVVTQTPVFNLLKIEREDPRREGKHGTFWVLEPPAWVNIVAMTSDRRLVMVRQYRQGNGHITMEIPGGAVDPEESMLEAAKRELREETGYVSDSWERIGVMDPNPAIQNNRCETYLARHVQQLHETDFDEFEDIEIELVSVESIDNRIACGEITHAIILSALTFLRIALEREGRETIQMSRPPSEVD